MQSNISEYGAILECAQAFITKVGLAWNDQQSSFSKTDKKVFFYSIQSSLAPTTWTTRIWSANRTHTSPCRGSRMAANSSRSSRARSSTTTSTPSGNALSSRERYITFTSAETNVVNFVQLGFSVSNWQKVQLNTDLFTDTQNIYTQINRLN